MKAVNRLGYARLTDMTQTFLEDLSHSETRVEIMTQRVLMSRFQVATPAVYHTILDPTDRGWSVMQDLSDHLLIAQPSRWTDMHEQAVVRAMASLHASYWDQKETLAQYKWLRHFMSDMYTSNMPFWQEVLSVFRRHHGAKFAPEQIVLLEEVFDKIEAINNELEHCAHTVVHGDLHRGNICFRPDRQRRVRRCWSRISSGFQRCRRFARKAIGREATPGNSGMRAQRGDSFSALPDIPILQPVIYDWGGTHINVPETDLFNFITRHNPLEHPFRFNHLIDLYLNALPESISRTLNPESCKRNCAFSSLQFLPNRVFTSLLREEPVRHLTGSLRWAEYAFREYF